MQFGKELTRRQVMYLTALGVSAPTAMRLVGAGAQDGLGASLIGELEGPTLILDPEQFPTEFNEAPDLAAMVEAGDLPPVADRIGQDPLVLQPHESVGQYGGIWRRGFTGPGDRFNGWRAASGTDALLYYDWDVEGIVPNIARDWEVSEDGRVVTIHMRRGMHWSDGTPFTTADVMFWYEDIYGNEELTPAKTQLMFINGKEGVIEAIDEYTFEMQFEDPYYLLPELLAGHTDLGGQSSQALYGNGLYAPAHYLKQFHPNYAEQADIDKAVADSGLDNWTVMFLNLCDWTINPELPALTPWVTVSPANTDTWSLARNPYSIWVDNEGNQLPYFDEIVMTLAEDSELLNLRAVAGDYDFQARHINMMTLPVLLDSQEQGDYSISLDPGTYGSDQTVAFNLSYQADPAIGELIRTTDFRRGLALGINRDELNETYWLGIGTGGSMAPLESNRFSPGEEYRNLWATYDPEQANALLDSVGLTDRDDNGYRMHPNGEDIIRFEIQSNQGGLMPSEQVAEMVVQQWQEIGILGSVRVFENTAGNQRTRANEHMSGMWMPDGNENLWIYPGMTFPYWMAQTMTGPLYAQWYQSNGRTGLEPPEWLKEVYTLFREGYGVTDEERNPIGQAIWKILIDEVAQIGLVGLSPASMGIRVVKNNVGNNPGRIYNSPASKNPAISRTMTYFYK